MKKFYMHEIAVVNLSKKLLPEKRKENMQTKQPRFKIAIELNQSKQ